MQLPRPALGLAAAAAFGPTATAATVNPAPAVQPSIHQWTGGIGSFVLSSATRIVVDPSHSADLSAGAQTFATDLAALTGSRFPVVTAAASTVGDIFLTEGATTPAASG